MFHLKSSLKALTAVVFCLFPTHVCRGQSHHLGKSQPIVAELRDDVTLPCHLEPAQDAQDFTLEWTRLDLNPRFVHVWRTGVELQDKQNLHFKGRTSLFADELKHGNISLKLVKVKPGDEGTYRCYIPAVEQQSLVQVLVGAASSPIIKPVELHTSNGSVELECWSSGWYPEPEVSWMDAEGHPVSAGPPETVRGPDDLYTINSRVTVDQRHGNTFTCRVHQTRTNQTREDQIRVSDDFFMVQTDCSTITQALTISLVLVTVALISLSVLLLKTHLNKNKTKRTHQEEEMKTLSVEDEDECKDEEQGLMTNPEPVDNRGKKNETEDSGNETDVQSVLMNQQKNQEPEDKQHTGSKQVSSSTLWTTFTRPLNWLTSSSSSSSSPQQRHPTDQQKTDQHMEEQMKEEQKEETDEDLKSIQHGLEDKDFMLDQTKRHVEHLRSENQRLQQELDMKNKQLEENQQKTDELMEDLKKMNKKNVENMTKYEDEKEQKKQFMKKYEDEKKQKEQFMTKYQDEKERREKAEKELQSLKEKKLNNPEVSHVPHLHPNTSGSSTVTVDKVDPQGRSVDLRNSSRQVQPMKGWTLTIKTDIDELIEYTFNDSFKLQSGKTVTILADGVRGSHDPHTEQVWNGQKPWNRGQEVCVTIYNDRGQVEDSKCEQLKQSEQNQTDQNRTDVTLQSSEPGPDIEVRINEDGKFICLFNRSKKNVELKGWKISVHTGKQAITYTIQNSVTLTCGKYVTIWAKGCGLHSPPSSLVWKDLKPWTKGTPVNVTLQRPL